ncbi:MAG TPA: hypothetical protein VHC63_09310 [Acidimicrobiales bacterium]|nr:hypothetical protein [Acidimicrobiales bacterium]
MSDNRLAVAGVVAVFFVAAYAARYSVSIALAVLLWGIAATVARRHVRGAVVAGLAFIAIIPIYWVPNIPGSTVAASPVVLVCATLLPAALELRHRIRIGVLDRLVIAYSVLVTIAYLVNTSGGFIGAITGALFSSLLPYATFRLLSLRREMSTSAAIGVLIGAVVSAIVAVREYRGVKNPFFALFPRGHAHAFFARADTRLGHPRPEASFGQAIALGMFLVLAIVLVLGLAWRREGKAPVPRPVLYGVALLSLFALTENLVRGPLVMLAFAVVVLLISESRRGHHGRGVVIAVGLAVLVNVGSFANVLQLRDQTFSEGSSVNLSGEYRVEIWHVVSDRSNFSLVGKQVVDEDGVGFTAAAGQDVGLKSFDNAYALIYIGYGVLALLVFMAIALRVGKAALLDRLAVIDHAWAAAILAAFINLMTVNLLTQFAHIFWIGIGLIASAIQRAGDEGESEEPPTADYRLSPWISRPSSA